MILSALGSTLTPIFSQTTPSVLAHPANIQADLEESMGNSVTKKPTVVYDAAGQYKVFDKEYIDIYSGVEIEPGTTASTDVYEYICGETQCDETITGGEKPGEKDN